MNQQKQTQTKPIKPNFIRLLPAYGGSADFEAKGKVSTEISLQHHKNEQPNDFLYSIAGYNL